MPSLQILPECFADTALIQLFVANHSLVVHIFGIPNVAKEMQEAATRENAGLRIGCVDNDKRVPPYLLTFNTVLEQNKVLLKQKSDSNKYLIVIDKAIESFLLWNARQISIDVSVYGFTDDIKLFGKALKTSSIGANSNYLQLLTDLRERQAPGFLTLERILNDLIFT
ncbi:hypothetical protein ACFSUS_06155 [Spirosoma soli]|uniref:Uncharacterized protein n=1 Tax=Spirosoma soli TaxID=1770529 RepID=A0ABW5M1Q4_9BACT